MHSLFSVFNPLHSNINIYAYSPYFSLCSDKENLLNSQKLFISEKENLLNNQGIFCQWFNLMDDIFKAKLVRSHYLGF